MKRNPDQKWTEEFRVHILLATQRMWKLDKNLHLT